MGRSPTLVEDQVTYPIVSSLLGAPHVDRRARLLDVRHVVRLRDLRGGHRRLLGAQPRARVHERHPRPPARGRRPGARARRDRHRLGVPVRARRQDGQARPRRAAHVPGLHPALRARQRAGRRRGGERRRLPEAVPGRRSTPNKLRAYGVTLERGDRARSATRTTTSAGASSRCRAASTTSAAAATSRTSPTSSSIALRADGPTGTPVLVRDVGSVRFGPDIRRGLLEWNGEGEAVGGIVVMRYGENALEVIERVKQQARASSRRACPRASRSRSPTTAPG